MLKHSFVSPRGVYYYQRWVPTDLLKSYPGRVIKKSLKTTDPSVAALHIAKLDRQYDAEFAQRRLNPNAEITQRDREALAERALKDIADELGLELRPGETEAGYADKGTDEDGKPTLEEVVGKLDLLTDYVVDNYDGRGANAEALGKTIIKVAKSGRTYFLSDVRDLYAQRHEGKREGDDIRKNWDLLINHLGEDLEVEALRREHAVSFRDSLGHLGRGTIDKYLGRVRGGLEVYRKDINRRFDNVFREVDLSGVGKEPVERLPLSSTETAELIETLTKRNDQNDLDRILLLLLATGARLGEIVGLRLQDIREATDDEQVTSILITAHEKRSLKNKGSAREVPVVLFGLTALQAQKEEAQALDSDYLFPRYNKAKKTNSNSASAATNKRMKALGFEDHSSHNLRHTSKRLMRDAGVTKDVTDIIHGHAGSTVADTYGRGVALGRMKEALEAAFEGLVAGDRP